MDPILGYERIAGKIHNFLYDERKREKEHSKEELTAFLQEVKQDCARHYVIYKHMDGDK